MKCSVVSASHSGLNTTLIGQSRPVMANIFCLKFFKVRKDLFKVVEYSDANGF